MRKTVANLGQYGILKDPSSEEMPENAWSDGRNMRFRNQYAERFSGEAQLYAPNVESKTWIYCLTRGDGSFIIVTVGATTCGAYDGVADNDISGTISAPANAKVVGDELSGIVVFTNRTDRPQYWAGNTATPFAVIPDWPVNYRCKSIRPYKNYLVAVGIYDGTNELGQMIKVSAAADPGAVPAAWTPANTNDAEERDMPGKGICIDTLVLGNRLIVYKSESYGYLQFIGGSEVYQTDVINQEYGMLSQNCAAPFPGGHIVLGRGDVYTHAGGQPSPLLEARMRAWLFAQIDTTNRDKCFVVSNPRKSEAWICFPDQGQIACTTALVWNWQDNTFSIRDLPSVLHGSTGVLPFTLTDTWSADTETWDVDTTTWGSSDFSQAERRLSLVSSANQLVYVADQGNVINGSSTTLCYLQRQGYNFGGDAWAMKTLKSLFLRIEAAIGTVFTVYFGSQLTASGSVVWQSAITYTQGTSLKADAFTTGRFNAIRIECREATPWRMRSFDPEWDVGGMF
jgi:hypothetical protein